MKPAAAVACCVLLALSPEWLQAQVDPQLPQRYRDAGVLRWGADVEAPFVFIDATDPAARETGFEVEIARELSRVLGVRTVRVQSQYDQLMAVLLRGDCDFVMNGFEPLPARRQEALFTRPYYIFQQQLTVAKGTTGITSLADLHGRRLGVLNQSKSHRLALAADVEVVVYESNTTAYEDLKNGRTVAALADLPIAHSLGAKFPELVHVGEPFDEDYYCLAVKRSDAELRRALDAAIDVLCRDGSLERIYRKYEMWGPAEQKLGDPELVGRFQDEGPARGLVQMPWSTRLGLLLHGALKTLGISVAAFAIAIVLGLCIALLRLHGPWPLRRLSVVYVEVLRGTPILVQLLLLYYGLGQFEWLRQVPAEWFGIVGLGLNYAAYEAEIYRGALSAIPRGQREAAMALGLSGAQTLRYVVIPQALRLSLAPSTNDFIALFKDSSIVMVITVVELTKQYQILANESGGQFLALGLVTSGLYLAMSLPLAYAARRFEAVLDKDRT